MNYATCVSHLIADLHHLLMTCVFDRCDAELIACAPSIRTDDGTTTKIDYDTTKACGNSGDMLFDARTLDTLLRVRFVLVNHRACNHNTGGGGGEHHHHSSSSSTAAAASASLSSSFSVSSHTHRFVHAETHALRSRMPWWSGTRVLVERVYLALCRLPVLDRFLHIPDSLWRTPHYTIAYSQLASGPAASTLPPLDYLRDPLVLAEHVRHTLSVGWTTRAQFEYEYVNMLTLLHNLSIGDEAQLQQQQMQNADGENSGPDGRGQVSLPVEELNERNKCICLVIRALASWLIKSTLTPKSGSSLHGLHEQVSRNKPHHFLATRIGRQYMRVKCVLESFAHASRHSAAAKQQHHHHHHHPHHHSIANDSSSSSLLYMLDPTLADDTEMLYQQHVSPSNSETDFAQQQQQQQQQQIGTVNQTIRVP